MSKGAQFIVLAVFLGSCFLAGILGFLWTPRLVAFRMQKMKERRLDKYVWFLGCVLRALFISLAFLSGYVLTKMPLVYYCAF